jgi:hypothetical protein
MLKSIKKSISNWFHRFSKDYEYLVKTSKSMIYNSMINIMVRRLAKYYEY